MATLAVVLNEDGSRKIINKKTRSSILLPSNFLPDFLADVSDASTQQLRKYLENIIDQICRLNLIKLPNSLRLALEDVLFTRTTCIDQPETEWSLCNYMNLENEVQPGDDVQYLSVKTPVRLGQEVEADSIFPSIEADVINRALVWIVPQSESLRISEISKKITRSQLKHSLLKKMVLVSNTEVVWQNLSLFDVKHSRMIFPTRPQKIEKILYSKLVSCDVENPVGGMNVAYARECVSEPKVNNRFDSFIQFCCLIDSKQILFTGSDSRAPAAEVDTESAAKQPNHANRYPLVIGMGVMIKNPSALTDIYSQYPELSSHSFKYIPGVVTGIKDDKITVQVHLNSAMIPNALIADIGSHALFSTNVQVTVIVTDVNRCFLVSPAELRCKLCSVQSSAHNTCNGSRTCKCEAQIDEMYVIGKVFFDHESSFRYCNSGDLKSSDWNCLYGSFLGASRTEWNVAWSKCKYYTVKPLSIWCIVRILTNRLIDFHSPLIESYRHLIGNSIERLARKNVFSSRKALNTFPLHNFGCFMASPRIFVGLMGLFVCEGKDRIMNLAHKVSIEIKSALTLKKLLENTMSIPVYYSDDDSTEVVFDFGVLNGSNTRVHFMLPVTFECSLLCCGPTTSIDTQSVSLFFSSC